MIDDGNDADNDDFFLMMISLLRLRHVYPVWCCK